MVYYFTVGGLQQFLDIPSFDIPVMTKKIVTVQPVLSGTILSGHPLLSNHLAKS